jgi:hypothetical protein
MKGIPGFDVALPSPKKIRTMPLPGQLSPSHSSSISHADTLSRKFDSNYSLGPVAAAYSRVNSVATRY